MTGDYLSKIVGFDGFATAQTGGSGGSGGGCGVFTLPAEDIEFSIMPSGEGMSMGVVEAVLKSFSGISKDQFPAIRRVWDFVQSQKLLRELVLQDGSLNGEELAAFIMDVFGIEVEVVVKSQRGKDGLSQTIGGESVSG